MLRSIILSTLCGVLMVEGFAPPLSPPTNSPAVSKSSLAAIPLDHHLIDAAATSSSWLLSTIDSDIASIPENEFKPVFMGGVVVMFGGLISTLMVGFILESKDLYASVVADSYAQGAEDEEFWKGLSEDEKVKTRELLAKIKGEDVETTTPPVEAAAAADVVVQEESSPEATADPSESKSSAESSKVDMFSDY